MKKEEIQSILERFGFSISISRKIGETPITHMIHSNTTLGKIVEYNMNEVQGLIERIWAFHDKGLEEINTPSALENWLNG